MWQPAFSVDPITTRFTPNDEQAIFRFRVLDAAGALRVDTEIPWFLNMLNCQKAWEISKGRGAVVVMSDQGFHIKHPDLIGRIAATEQFGSMTFDDAEKDFHGTDMSRILLAVAPEARIVPVLCSGTPWDDKQSWGDNIAKSFQYAADVNADVVSASWADWFNTNQNILTAVSNVVDHGVVVSWFHYPHAYPGLLRPAFTYPVGWESEPRLGFADRFLTDPPGFHPVEIEAGLSGTAPQAAGIAALVRSVDPKLSPAQIEALIVQNATPIGGGILIPDVYKTLVAAAQPVVLNTPAARHTDNINLPFVNDPQVIGEWKSVDYVANISDFNPDKPNTPEDKLYLKGLIFGANGTTSKPWETWTKGALVHHGDQTASHYEILNIKGQLYMFLEWKDGEVIRGGMIPEYYVLKKTLTFGSTIEREIEPGNASRRALNLAFGSFVEPSPGRPLDYRIAGTNSLRAAGVDLYAQDGAPVPNMLTTLDLRECVGIFPQEGDESKLTFDTITADEVRQSLADMENWRSTNEIASIPGMDLRKATDTLSGTNLYLFITRNDVEGVLQITGFTENPSAVMIRYKLVQNTASEAVGSAPLPFKNLGMEDGSGSSPADWQIGIPVEGVEQIWDHTTAHSGKASLCLKKTARHYFPIARWNQEVAVTPESQPHKLRVRCWVKAENVTKAIIDVGYEAEKSGHVWAAYIGQKESSDPVANHDWKLYEGTVTIPAGTTSLEIAFQIYGPGTVWFDDLDVAWME